MPENFQAWLSLERLKVMVDPFGSAIVILPCPKIPPEELSETTLPVTPWAIC